MSQLIIEHNYLGQWSLKYTALPFRDYVSLSVPRRLWQKDRIIGVTVDNRKQWRKKLDSITQNVDYEIIHKEQAND